MGPAHDQLLGPSAPGLTSPSLGPASAESRTRAALWPGLVGSQATAPPGPFPQQGGGDEGRTGGAAPHGEASTGGEASALLHQVCPPSAPSSPARPRVPEACEEKGLSGRKRWSWWEPQRMKPRPHKTLPRDAPPASRAGTRSGTALVDKAPADTWVMKGDERPMERVRLGLKRNERHASPHGRASHTPPAGPSGPHG